MKFSGHKTSTCVAALSYYCHAACDDDAVNISLRPTTILFRLLQFFIFFGFSLLFRLLLLFSLSRIASHIIIESRSLKAHH